MAPIKVIKVTPQTKPQPATAPAHEAPAKTVAPMQNIAVTGQGPTPKTSPTFNQNPRLKPNPPDNGSTQIVSDVRQPSPAGPAKPAGGVGVQYSNAQQPIDK